MIFRDAEAQHRALYEAHWLLVAAAEKLHGVSVACHAAGRHSDAREKIKPMLSELEKARDAADMAWTTASRARVEMTRLTGCDGSCHEGAAAVVERTLQAKTETEK